MKVFRGLPNAESRAPCALTIGNFDGVHRGHQALLARVRAAADARGLPVCVMTFEPHPREFFNPAGAPPRIAMLRDKLEALRENGVDRVVVEHFNHTFANQAPEAFVEQTLVNGLHTRWMIVGDDFCYGARRAGNFASLQEAGARHGFDVEQMATLAAPNGARISSSGVRSAVNRKLWRLFGEHGISVPLPQRELRIVGQGPAASAGIGANGARSDPVPGAVNDPFSVWRAANGPLRLGSPGRDLR
ncbi:adenylyltransferase/cytidyltransferase family protein, partial [Burkholderia gladioli]|nr:adenylyltransferase/cytidyltransferase family protein [Burkholderia gladioli]